MKNEGFRLLALSIPSALFGSGLLLVLIFLTNPYINISLSSDDNIQVLQKNYPIISLFYLGLFLFIFGVSSTLFFLQRIKKNNDKNIASLVTVSLRQGILLGILTIVLMFLQSLRLLIWWDALLVVGAILLVELYLSVK